MSAIGSARRCCRGCGKERGPSRRRRRRQQPCLSSCSSSCCCSDSASPAAFVSPTAASRPPGPAAMDRAGLHSGRRASGCTRFGRLACGLGTATAKAPAPAGRRVQRYCDRCARAGQEGGGNLFVQRLGYPIGTPQPPPFGRSSPWTPSGGGGRPFRLRSGNFYCQRHFKFSSAHCPPVRSAGNRDGLFPCGKICPAPGGWSLWRLSEAIFPFSAGELFRP